MKYFLYWFRATLSLIGLLGAISLSWDHYLSGEACPIIGVPVCYVIALVFAGLCLGAFLEKQRNIFSYLFWGCLVIGLGISTIAAFGQLAGSAHCPLTSVGIPMCYLAWSLFFLIFLISIILSFMAKKS